MTVFGAKTHLYFKGGRKPHKLSCELQRKRPECVPEPAVDKVIKHGKDE